jgi:hypothetical protein
MEQFQIHIRIKWSHSADSRLLLVHTHEVKKHVTQQEDTMYIIINYTDLYMAIGWFILFWTK